MKKKYFLIGILLSFIFQNSAFNQQLTQVIRGKIVDTESQAPLSFTTISITTVSPPIGTTSDENGVFRLENVPVGRHNLQVSFVGYEPQVIPELLVGSGKEVVLSIGLKESLAQVEEVVVKAYAQKDKPLNSMATLSARTFSVEEAQRYAGGFDDPARLASSFAGVSTGYLDDNGIIVRGNAPKGLLWRLEGVEIPNPNHFAGMTTFGGGGVSALSSLMLANSDFYTGAFPAEYGNAMSGIFDIRLRNGNNENYEHAVQAGALGIDLASEGPLSKNSNASYLFNYRYSTFGIIKFVLPEEANIPIYQDLCFKINMPTQKAGVFSVWGLGTVDKIDFLPEEDTADWKTTEDQEIGGAKQRMGALGVNHKYILNKKSYVHTSMALTGDYTKFGMGVVDYDMIRSDIEFVENTKYKYTLASTLNYKFSAKHSNRIGFIADNYNYRTLIKSARELGETLEENVNENGTSNLFHAFTQSKYSFSEKFKLNIGLHAFYYNINDEFTFEPRIGMTYNITNVQSISLAYGNHSRMEPQSLYFAKVSGDEGFEQPNKSLRLSKANHFVFSYDLNLSTNMRLKVEPYLQLLYDIPVIPDSSYSALNMEADWFFRDKLTSEGTGTNYGIDITLERFLNDGYYFLLTGSIFESTYVGGDDIERKTRYSTGFVGNALFGKEWVLGVQKNKILGINGRLNILGGQRITPVDRQASLAVGEIVFDYNRPFEEQKPTVWHLNASVTYRINKKNHSSIWALQVLNALATEEFYGYNYNYKTNEIDRDAVPVVVPSISYKIEF